MQFVIWMKRLDICVIQFLEKDLWNARRHSFRCRVVRRVKYSVRQMI